MKPIKALHLFTDEEGSAPFVGPVTDLFKYDSEVEFKDGIVSGCKYGHRLVYLGDLMDRYPNEIKLMTSMIRLSDEDKITLIAGNRDVNKLRLVDELRMYTLDDEGKKVYPEFTKPDDVVQYALREDALFEEIDHVSRFKTWNNAGDRKEIFSSGSKATERLDLMVGLLMGVSRPRKCVEVKMEEAADVFSSSNLSFHLKTDEQRARFVCLLYTILGGGYRLKTESHPSLNGFRRLEGLYLEFLKRCKIMSLESVGSTSVLVAHGGVPDLISNPVGLKDRERGSPRAASEVIDEVNEDFRKHIEGSIQRTKSGNDLDMEVLYYYIGLSGPVQTNTAFGPDESFDYNNSPIVTRNRLKKVNHKTLYHGGDEHRNGHGHGHGHGHGPINYEATVYADLTTGNKKVDYVVFGHTPVGNAPSVWATGETVYAAIDVSSSTDDLAGPKEYRTCSIMSIYDDGKMRVRGQSFHNEELRAYENTLCDYERYGGMEIETNDHRYKYTHDSVPSMQFTDTGNKYVILKEAYDASEGRRIPECDHLVMVVSNGNGPIDSHGMVAEYLKQDKNRPLLESKRIIIGFDGDPPGTPPAELVGAFVRALGKKVIGVVQVQVHGLYGLPMRQKDYYFKYENDVKCVPLYTFVYQNAKDRGLKEELDNSKFDYVIDIGDADGARQNGAWGGFDAEGNAKGSTAAWIRMFESEDFFVPSTKKCLAAFWDHSDFVHPKRGNTERNYRGSITESTIGNAERLTGSSDSVTLVERGKKTFASVARDVKGMVGPVHRLQRARGLWESYRNAFEKILTVSPDKDAFNILLVIDMQNDFIDGSLEVDGSLPVVNAVKRLIGFKGCWDGIYATKDYHPEGHSSFRALPEHCVAGRDGSKFNKDVKEALLSASPRPVVFYKGLYGDVDSFSGVKYPYDDYSIARLFPVFSKCEGKDFRDCLQKTGGYTLHMHLKEKELMDEDPDAGTVVRTNDLGTELGDYILNRERNGKPVHVYVCGLALDFCVKDTAINAAKLLRANGVEGEVRLVLDASRPVGVKQNDGNLETAEKVASDFRENGVVVVKDVECPPPLTPRSGGAGKAESWAAIGGLAVVTLASSILGACL